LVAGLDRVEQPCPGNEHHAGTSQRKQPSGIAGIGVQVMLRALDRAERDCIDDEPHFGPGLDGEETRDPAHAQRLSKQRANGGFAPFRF
jgi:hypothetical protein